MTRYVMSATVHRRPLRGTTRMFESDLIERFSRVQPWVPALIYLPLMAVSLWTAVKVQAVPVGRVTLEFVAGYMVWTLVEYWLHRLLFHVRVRGPRTQRLYFLLHGVHHDYPWDSTRLVFPPGASVALCVGVYGLFRLLLGNHGMYGPFAGLLLGYVLYDTTHWYVHVYTPKNAFGRWLRREHMIHHFKDPTSRFGVSCPWLDHVFGTSGRLLAGSRREPQRDTSSVDATNAVATDDLDQKTEHRSLQLHP